MQAQEREPLKCVDLFCGPGGFSQGLRLAGIRTIYAVDLDAAAVETFARNHPEAAVVRRDVAELDPADLPEFDLLVGGPPCIEFSSSKGGRANILDGLRLVQAFLRVVHARRPRYWVMENVPRLVLHLPERIPLRWIGVDDDGALLVPVRGEFNAADYGVPQVRRRFLMGNFPPPLQTHRESEPASLFVPPELPRWLTLRDVVSAFPAPNCPERRGTVTDPVFGFDLPTAELSDHFQDVALTDEEAARIREVKTNHPYMGRMAFPDDLNRPARTVVATQLGRETLVLSCGEAGRFRRATVRECATLQGFPVTFQFWAGGLSARYRLAGDAVPPPLAYAVGREIVRAEGLAVPGSPLVTARVTEPSPPLEPKPRRARRHCFPLGRRFKRMVPGKEVRGCRVDFDNVGDEPTRAVLFPPDCRNLVEWTARLHVGEGKAAMRQRPFRISDALWEFAGFCLVGGERARSHAVQFLDDANERLAGTLPDATTLQAVWAGHCDEAQGPDAIAATLASLVDRHFPASDFVGQRVPPSGRYDLVPQRGLLVRLAAGLVVTALACEIINADGRWAARQAAKRYRPEGWRRAIPAEEVPAGPSPVESLEATLRDRGAHVAIRERAG